jgi:hypothetical protein
MSAGGYNGPMSTKDPWRPSKLPARKAHLFQKRDMLDEDKVKVHWYNQPYFVCRSIEYTRQFPGGGGLSRHVLTPYEPPEDWPTDFPFIAPRTVLSYVRTIDGERSPSRQTRAMKWEAQIRAAVEGLPAAKAGPVNALYSVSTNDFLEGVPAVDDDPLTSVHVPTSAFVPGAGWLADITPPWGSIGDSFFGPDVVIVVVFGTGGLDVGGVYPTPLVAATDVIQAPISGGRTLISKNGNYYGSEINPGFADNLAKFRQAALQFARLKVMVFVDATPPNPPNAGVGGGLGSTSDYPDYVEYGSRIELDPIPGSPTNYFEYWENMTIDRTNLSDPTHVYTQHNLFGDVLSWSLTQLAQWCQQESAYGWEFMGASSLDTVGARLSGALSEHWKLSG